MAPHEIPLGVEDTDPEPVPSRTTVTDTGLFVRAKFAGVAPVTEPTTLYAPAVVLAVNVDDVAMPLAFVVSLSVARRELLKVPEAPEEGAVNLTVTPESALPDASFTSAASGVAKAEPTVCDCGEDPATVCTLAGAPALMVTTGAVRLVGEPFTVSEAAKG